MTEPGDLTRWNRAGLRRVRYVDGNAAEYLERLRANLARQFPRPNWSRLHEVPDPDAEGEQQRLQRVEEQYTALRRDWGWELARAVARASHILNGHVDAYANESYIHTATQWDNLRKLVEMLDYHPSPPASAATVVALEAKPGQKGTVAAGMQCKHAPPNGDAVVFETLEDLEVDAELNAIRLWGADRSNDTFDPFACGAASPWRYTEALEASVGEVVVAVQDPKQMGAAQVTDLTRHAAAARITYLADDALCIGPGLALATTWVKGATHLAYGAKDSFAAHLNGDDVVVFAEPHGLSSGHVVCWLQAGTWVFNSVAAAEERTLRLADAASVPTLLVYVAVRIIPLPTDDHSGLEFRVPLDTAAAVYRGGEGVLVTLPVGDFEIISSANEIAMYKRLKTPIDAMEIYIARAEMSTSEIRPLLPLVGEALTANEGIYTFDGKPGDLASGQVLVGEGLDEGRRLVLQAVEVMSVTRLEQGFQLRLCAVGAAVQDGVDTDGMVDLLRLLRQVELCLDQSAFDAVTLQELVSGAVAARSVVAIQGVGPLRVGDQGYTDRLREVGVYNIGELAQVQPSALREKFSQVKLRELKAKAEMVVNAQRSSAGLTELLPLTLAQVLERYDQSALPASATSEAASPEWEFSVLYRLHGPFTGTLYPDGYDINTDPAEDIEHFLTLALPQLPPLLARGRKIIVEQVMGEESCTAALRCEVAEVAGNRVRLSPPLDAAAGYRVGNTVLRCNVVTAGHGEYRGEKVLGSGDATQSVQVFTFKVAGVAFVADATQGSGVRADITITVAGRIWRQVSSLKDSQPSDHDYTVTMTEDGFLQITFGDGRHGRRLPSGTNNVRIAFRQGSGLHGNIPAESFTKPAKPHALVKAVRQPFPATGGNDMEDAASLRENAPATVMTLERAVSLNDFSRLAAAHSSVWQARAVMQNAGYQRQQAIEVVVVPANGGALGGLKQTLEAYLREHAVPGVAVTVRDYVAVPYVLDIEVYVDVAAYNVEEVLPRVSVAVSAALALKQRKLGAALYLSDVYKVVETVAGVEFSQVTFWVKSAGGGAFEPTADKVLKVEDHSQVLVLESVMVNPIDPASGDVALIKGRRI